MRGKDSTRGRLLEVESVSFFKTILYGWWSQQQLRIGYQYRHHRCTLGLMYMYKLRAIGLHAALVEVCICSKLASGALCQESKHGCGFMRREVFILCERRASSVVLLLLFQ